MKIVIENARSDDSLLEMGDDSIGHRVVTVDDKYHFTIKSHDPYGHMTVSTEVGRTPREFDGVFTDISAVTTAIKAYVTRKIAEDNKPPRDKNTRKIKELLEARDASAVSA